jgi:ribosomal protein S18 acetylase RimI-like enzyme
MGAPSPAELDAISRHLCTLPVHAGATVEEDPELGVLLVHQAGRSPGADLDYAARPRWSLDDWRWRLAQVERLVHERGSWPSLLVADRLDRPDDLQLRLPEAGWTRVHAESVLWVDRAPPVPHLEGRLRIQAVRPGAVSALEALERGVFGFPEGEADLRRLALATALGTGRLRAFLVRFDEAPVACARLSQGDGVAGIYAVGVAERHRGRGLGSLVTTVATRAGLALGNRLVWLSVRDDNEPAVAVYKRLGYRPAFTWSRWMALDHAATT